MYQVWIEYDGCINEPKASFEGSREQCLNFMRRKRAPKLCHWALMDKETGRLVSYML